MFVLIILAAYVVLNLVNSNKMYSEFWLIWTNYAAQLGSKAEKRQQIRSTYNSPKKLKSIPKIL